MIRDGGNSNFSFALDEIKIETRLTKRSVLDQITFENYSYYLGFDKL